MNDLDTQTFRPLDNLPLHTDEPNFQHHVEARLTIALLGLSALSGLALYLYGHVAPGF